MNDILGELINNYQNHFWEQGSSKDSIRLGKVFQGNIEFGYNSLNEKYQIEIHAFNGDSDGDTQLRGPQEYSIETSTGKLIKELIELVIPLLDDKNYFDHKNETGGTTLLTFTNSFINTNFLING